MTARAEYDTPDDLLLTMFRHGRWANQVLLDRASQLSQDELRSPIGEGAFADLLGTLLHIYDVEESWLDRIRNGTSGPSLSVEDYPDIPPCAEPLEYTRSRTRSFYSVVYQTRTEAIASSVRSQGGSTGSFPIKIMLSNMFFHSQQHRGEVALGLTALGQSPGDLGMIYFLKQESAIERQYALP